MNNLKILDRKNNGSMKWDLKYIQKRFGISTDDVYPMFIADMDFACDSKIHSAISEYIKTMDFGYFNIQDRYYDSVIGWYKRIHKLEIDKDWIVPTIGTIASIATLVHLFNDNKVLMLTPVYSGFGKCVSKEQSCFSDLVYKDGKYSINFLDLEEKLKSNEISILLFCNPHNPSGKIWSLEDLSKVVQLCKKYDVLIISDEIHSDLNISNTKHYSLIEFCDDYDNVIVASSGNKTFNISGLNCSYLILKNEIIKEKYNSFMNLLHMSSNRFGLDVATIAYELGDSWLSSVKEEVKGNIEILVSNLSKTNMEIMLPECGYLVWVYLPDVDDVDVFVSKLALKTNVLIETGSRFLQNYKSFVRINVATSPDIVLKASKLIADFYLNKEWL